MRRFVVPMVLIAGAAVLAALGTVLVAFPEAASESASPVMRNRWLTPLAQGWLTPGH